MSYIYKIINNVNGKLYIGKTKRSLSERFKEHVTASRREDIFNRPLYKAFRKHGIENFTLEKSITRSNVSTATKIAYNHSKPISTDKMSQIVGDEGFNVLDGSQPVKCTLK